MGIIFNSFKISEQRYYRAIDLLHHSESSKKFNRDSGNITRAVIWLRCKLVRDDNRSELLSGYFEKVEYHIVTAKLILKDHLKKGSQTFSKCLLCRELWNIVYFLLFYSNADYCMLANKFPNKK